MYKTRTDESEKARVEEICKANKGSFTNFSDGSYKCAGVMDATIEHELGKVKGRTHG